jgi:HlyD family secretion protein
VQAEAALRTAENNVAQAQVAYENTLSAERTGVERAEGELSIAQAQLGQLRAGADADQLAAARAQVAAARANLAKLGGEQRAGALQAAQAAVALAEARLGQLQSGPQPAELDAAEAQVQSAQAQFDLARLALEEASLVAPFDGEIAEVGLRAGELPSPGRSAVTLADLSRLHVTVTVDEVDIAKIRAGQPVSLTLDALPDASLSGTVASIAPLAQPATAVTSYAVRITITSTDARVRPGMSTNADILVDRRVAALVVPRRAVRSDRGRLLVDVAREPGLCGLPPEQLPAEPALETREVRVGLSNEQAIEIVSGVDPADCLRVEGVDARLNLLNGPPGPRR